VRNAAMFCPQCGNPIAREQTTSAPETAQTQAFQTVTTTDDSDHIPQTAHTQKLPETSNSPARGGVAGNVRERVEKIRHVSSVVIDQAAYDPSLRFLLVAAALFLLFILLVLVSKVLG
jgi:hypothetical protein